MKRTIKTSQVLMGIGCLVVFLFSVNEYHSTRCVTPYFYEPVCGQQALVVLGAYALLGLLGVYLIIRGLKLRNGDNETNKEKNV